MEHKYFYILYPECSMHIPLCQNFLLPSFLQVPAKPLDPYLWPSPLSGKVNNQMHCPNSGLLGGTDWCPSLWGITQAWVGIRGADGEDWQFWRRRRTTAASHQQGAPADQAHFASKNIWCNSHLQSIKDVFLFCFPIPTEISVVGKTAL